MFKSEKGRQVDEILLCRGGMASHPSVLSYLFRHKKFVGSQPITRVSKKIKKD